MVLGFLKDVFTSAVEHGRNAYRRAFLTHEQQGRAQANDIMRHEEKERLRRLYEKKKAGRQSVGFRNAVSEKAYAEARRIGEKKGYSEEQIKTLAIQIRNRDASHLQGIHNNIKENSAERDARIKETLHKRAGNISRGSKVLVKNFGNGVKAAANSNTTKLVGQGLYNLGQANGAPKVPAYIKAQQKEAKKRASIQEPIKINGHEAKFIDVYTDIRDASRKQTALRETGRLVKVKDVKLGTQQYIALYSTAVIEKKVKDKIEKVIEYNGKPMKYAGKYKTNTEAENKISDLVEKGYFAKFRNIILNGSSFIAVYAYKPSKKGVAA